MEQRPVSRFELPVEKAAPAPELSLAAPAAAAAPKADPTRIRLFDRYRSLTAKPKVERSTGPQHQAKVEGACITVTPQDRPVTSHSDDELDIPAFLRRQAN